jgi:di/tricarboxylate transporter
VAVGDATFVMNFQLAARASANRDFFLNCVAFLSGTDAISASGRESNIFISRLDRKLRRRFVRATAIISPVVVFVLMIALAAWRRRRG